MQRAYLDGLEADGTISGGGEGQAGEGFPAASAGGPTARRAEVATDVIDIGSMRAELEQRKRGE